jgi:hypothetical protein
MTCAKSRVIAVITTKSGNTYSGENVCDSPQTTCPRSPDDKSYALCKTVCKQREHAELRALHAAFNAGDSPYGGSMVIRHTHFCAKCAAVMAVYNITWRLG